MSHGVFSSEAYACHRAVNDIVAKLGPGYAWRKMVYCMLRWEMEKGLGAQWQTSQMTEQKQGRVGGAAAAQKCLEGAQETRRSGAAVSSEKPKGAVRRSRKGWERRQNSFPSMCHRAPMGNCREVESHRRVLS